MTKSRMSTCTVPRSWFIIEALTKTIIQEKEIKHIQIGKYYKLHINSISNFQNCKCIFPRKSLYKCTWFQTKSGLALVQCIHERHNHKQREECQAMGAKVRTPRNDTALATSRDAGSKETDPLEKPTWSGCTHVGHIHM